MSEITFNVGIGLQRTLVRASKAATDHDHGNVTSKGAHPQPCMTDICQPTKPCQPFVTARGECPNSFSLANLGACFGSSR